MCLWTTKSSPMNEMGGSVTSLWSVWLRENASSASIKPLARSQIKSALLRIRLRSSGFGNPTSPNPTSAIGAHNSHADQQRILGNHPIPFLCLGTAEIEHNRFVAETARLDGSVKNSGQAPKSTNDL